MRYIATQTPNATKQPQPDSVARNSDYGARTFQTNSLPSRDRSMTIPGGESNHCVAATSPIGQGWEMLPKKRKWNKTSHQRGTLFAFHQAHGDRVGYNQEQFKTVLRPELRKPALLPSTYANIETVLAGNSMKECWSSLRTCLGPKLSGLHSDILAFCRAHELTRQQLQVREAAQEYLKVAITEIWPDALVYLFGSTATGLALPSSDIDVVVVMSLNRYIYPQWPFPDTRPWVSELGKKLVKSLGMFQSVTPILNAKVPILKAVLRSGLTCDVSFDSLQNSSRQGVEIVRQFLRQYPALRPLCLVLKLFLRQQNLNEVFTGGIGSFCLTVMIVSHLRKLGADGALYDLGVLLLSFFERYSSRHNYLIDVVSARPGKCASKQSRGWVNIRDPERLAVENPLDPSSDIAAGSFNSHEVRAKFSQAKRVLLDNWHEEKLLDLMFKTCTV